MTTSLTTYVLAAVLVMPALGAASRPGLAAAQPASGAAERARRVLPGSTRVDTARTDTAQTPASHPNAVPYATKQRAAGQVLALPARLVRLAARPIGAAVTWADQQELSTNLENLFWNADRTFGALPEIQLGGTTPGAVGVVFVDRRLIRASETRLRLRYGGPSTYQAGLTIERPLFFGLAFSRLHAHYERDGSESLFLDQVSETVGGEADYETETAGLRLSAGVNPSPGGVSLFAAYRYARADFDGGEDGPARGVFTALPGADTDAHLTTVGASLLIGGPRREAVAGPRALGGRRLYAEYGFTAGLESGAFRYHRTVVEGQQYVPLPFAGPYRRLALRSRLEKTWPAGVGAVPFYEQPTLGTSELLRGAEQDRFQDEGTLLFTAEYRYPVRKRWDMVLFTDTGQAFGDFDAIRPADFHWGGGLGLHVYSASGLNLRFEVGVSEGNTRSFLETAPALTSNVRR